jgi:hypothetical protein
MRVEEQKTHVFVELDYFVYVFFGVIFKVHFAKRWMPSQNVNVLYCRRYQMNETRLDLGPELSIDKPLDCRNVFLAH